MNSDRSSDRGCPACGRNHRHEDHSGSSGNATHTHTAANHHSRSSGTYTRQPIIIQVAQVHTHVSQSSNCFNFYFAFSALTLLVVWQEGHLGCKTLSDGSVGMVVCLERGADLHMVQLMSLPLTVSCFSKSWLVLPVWYWITQVVPNKGPLNGCCCYLLSIFK